MNFFVVIDMCVCVCVNALMLSFSSTEYQNYSCTDKLGTETSACLSVSNVFNQKSRSSIFTALGVVKVGQKKIIMPPQWSKCGFSIAKWMLRHAPLFDISYLALLVFKTHDRINTYKPVPRPPHLTAPFCLMQPINLQVRITREDTRLTIRIFFSASFNSAVNCYGHKESVTKELSLKHLVE